MAEAVVNAPRGRDFCAPGAAAQIRAIAEWIEQRQVEDYAVTLPDVREVIGWLATEADRAERGDAIAAELEGASS